ncbi:MAG: mechanosensitive ion channel family protein [Xanthomonadales bacterium]|nr:mechanosensitive ion channel family protein [Xanthomonadales bacterium]
MKQSNPILGGLLLPFMAAIAFLFLWPGGALAETSSEPAPANEQEISSLLATLRDPQARAALERQLELMLEARQADEQQPGGDAPESVTAIVSNELGQLWEEVSEQPLERWVRGGLMTVGALLLAAIAYWLLRRLGSLAARLIDRAGFRAEDKDSDFVSSVTPLLRTGLRLAVLAGFLLALSQIWGINLREIVPDPLLGDLTTTLFALLVIGLLAFLAWYAVSTGVRLLFNRLTAGEISNRRAQRIRTLEPLVVSVGRFVIGTLTLLVMLAELGVEIGPLLAGAGVVGLAVGFGAQNLVRDFINGIMVVAEDAAGIGDVVEVAGHKGVVETMNMRIMTLRDLAGIVYTVPYGDITTIKNFTKDFSYALIDVGVAYREDIGEVIDELKNAGERLRQDSELGPKTLEDLEILGVDSLADSAVVIRVRMRVRANERWTIERALRRAFKDAFDAAGIEIPFPHTTLYFGESKQGEPTTANLQVTAEGKLERA